MGSSPTEPMQRLEVKMDNGKVQYTDTPSRDFNKGMRITLTPDATSSARRERGQDPFPEKGLDPYPHQSRISAS